jgi:hypothetical protein
MKKCFLLLALFLLISLILVTISVIDPAEMYAMNITVQTRDIPEHGLLLISATDPSFEENLSTVLLRNNIDQAPNTIKFLSVFLKNSGQQSLVAYQLKWELVDVNGRVSSYYRTFAGPLLLMEDSDPQEQSDKLTSEYTIAPSSLHFFSLVPMPSENRLGGTITSFSRSEGASTVESVKRAMQGRDVAELSKTYTEKLKESTSVRVSIEGAFFDDGSFVGPDESDFFASFKAHRDARYDLYNRVLAMCQSKKSADEILNYLTKLTSERISSPKPGSPPYEHYRFYTRVYADELSRIWKNSGEKAVVDFVESCLSKPWIHLRKL